MGARRGTLLALRGCHVPAHQGRAETGSVGEDASDVHHSRLSGIRFPLPLEARSGSLQGGSAMSGWTIVFLIFGTWFVLCVLLLVFVARLGNRRPIIWPDLVDED
jgi:hypothetical protein